MATQSSVRQHNGQVTGGEGREGGREGGRERERGAEGGREWERRSVKV